MQTTPVHASSERELPERELPEREADEPPTAKGSANANENPNEWVRGDAPMTAAQASLLLTLSQEAGEPFDPDLSKADASTRIEVLEKRAGRGHPKGILEDDQTDG